MTQMPSVRERPTAADMARLLAPRSIAVIGASSDPGKFSGRFIRFLLKNGYAGDIYPVNAKRDEIMGLPCFKELAAIPGLVDCVVYSIGAGGIPAVLEDCAAKGIKLLVITSSGFAERGDDEGRRLQSLVTDFTLQTGIRVIGPNCVGFVNFARGITLAAAAALDWPDMRAGSIGLASQSGGLSLGTILFNAMEEDIGFSHIISTGNEADLDVVDFGRFFVEDSATDVIALTLESVRDGTGFKELLEAAGQAGKPVVVLKVGRSELGQAMAASHTGAMAGSDEVFNAVCRRYGVTRVEDVDELYQVAQMFAKLRVSGKLDRCGSSPGAGCTALSVSGGHVGLFADLCSAEGLAFPALAEETQAGLKRELGATTSFHNPVDLSGGSVSDHSVWGRCLSVLLDDPAIRVAAPILTVSRNYDQACHDLISVAAAHAKAVFAVWPGGVFEGEGKALLRRSPIPFFSTPRRAAKAIGAWDSYCRVWAAPADRSAQPGGKIDPTLRDAVASGKTSLGERESKTMLAGLGFPVTREVLARSLDGAVAAAATIGFPIGLKGEHPDILHKTEAGIVRLGIDSPDALAEAYRDIERKMQAHAPNRPATGILVQEMVPGGLEFVLGVRKDEVFGPTVMFGLGGIFIEVLRDISLAVAPLSMADARAMMERTRGIKLLQGARGRHPVDLDRIAALLVALGDFAIANARSVREIDINPLVVIDRADDALRVVDALIVLEGTGHIGNVMT